MARAVVFGYGNPLRTDDAAGWRVAETIGREWGDRDVVVRVGHQLLPEWSADLSGVRVAYFVDASLVARRVRLTRVRTTSTADRALMDGHTIGPSQLLSLAAAVYAVRPAAYLLHVPGVNFEFGDELSAPAARGVQAALILLHRRLSESLN